MTKPSYWAIVCRDPARQKDSSRRHGASRELTAFLQAFKVCLWPTGGLHIRGERMTHRGSSGKQRRDTLPQTDAEDSIQLLSRRGLNNYPGGPAWLTNITKRHESLCFYNHLLASAYYQLSSQSKARTDTTACYLICIWSKFK